MNTFFVRMTILLTLFLAACGVQPAVPALVSTRTAVTAVPPAPAPSAPAPAPTAEKAVSPTQAAANGQIANPASTNCIQKGGRLDIRTDSSGGQFGMCVFPNGKECEEWALMRGECSPEGGASLLYRNTIYGFGFDYPSAWALAESAPTASSPLTVTLVNGSSTLRLQVKRPAEKAVLAAEAPQGGEISQQGILAVLGQKLPVQAIKLEGKVKSAAVNVDTGSLLFRFQLDNSSDPEIPADVLQDAQAIIASLQILK